MLSRAILNGSNLDEDASVVHLFNCAALAKFYSCSPSTFVNMDYDMYVAAQVYASAYEDASRLKKNTGMDKFSWESYVGGT